MAWYGCRSLLFSAMNAFIKDFMQDVPRGDSTRYLKQQRTPQARWMKIEDIQSSSALTYDPARPGKKVLIARWARA
jgi:type IV secretion system protein VirD4